LKSARRIRTRLTLHYTGVLALGLAVYGAGLYFVLSRHAYNDLDRRLGEDIEATVNRVERAPDGTLRFRPNAPLTEAEEEEGGGHWVEVWSEGGMRLLTSEPVDRFHLGGAPVQGAIDGGGRTVWIEGRPLRTVTREAKVEGGPALIRAATSEASVRDQLSDLLKGLLGLMPVVLVLAGLGGYLAARRDLRPLETMAHRAHEITAESLHERLPVASPDDELGQLAVTFNETFARLERSFDQLGRFTADASHELRTPLTALRSIGEVSLASPRTATQYRDVIGSMLEEVERLTRLVESLLNLSRADAGHIVLHPERFDLVELAREVLAHLGVLAEDRYQTLLIEAAAPVEVTADRVVIRQALVNLVDNAIKHSPDKTVVRLRVFTDARGAVLEVEDQGPGIPEEYRARVFDRFFRIDDRSRPQPRRGAGLGLALARWCVEASGGRIALDSLEGRGSTFRMILPGS